MTTWDYIAALSWLPLVFYLSLRFVGLCADVRSIRIMMEETRANL